MLKIWDSTQNPGKEGGRNTESIIATYRPTQMLHLRPKEIEEEAEKNQFPIWVVHALGAKILTQLIFLPSNRLGITSEEPVLKLHPPIRENKSLETSTKRLTN